MYVFKIWLINRGKYNCAVKMYWAQKIDWCCIWNRSLITSIVYASGIIPGPSNSTGIKFLYLFITNHNTSEWEFLFPWHYYINISIYLILYYLCLYLYINLYYLYVLNVKINIWFDLICPLYSYSMVVYRSL